MPDTTHRSAPLLLGIDLGTSTCLACMIRDGKPVFIQPDRAFFPRGYTGQLMNASNIMPSAFARVAGQNLVGDRALDKLTDPEHAACVMTEIKRHMDEDGVRKFRVGDVEFAPSQIAGTYVQVLRLAAERQLGLEEGSIRGGVVTVPASFGQRQCEATIKACEIGGLVRSQIHLIDEPVAAAYSLRLHERPTLKTVLVGDLGGGTFDVTLLRVGQPIRESGYEELGRDGELYLGGLDWDRPIAHRAMRALQRRDRLDEDYVSAILYKTMSGDRARDDEIRAAHNRIYESAEAAKKAFYRQFPSAGPLPASKNLAQLSLEAQPIRGKGYRPCGVTISADDHLRDTDGLVKRCIAVCERMFRDVSAAERTFYGWQNVDLVCLAGGGSYMATVRHAFAEAWGKNRDPIISPEPQHAVALGAALAAEEVRHGRRVSHLEKRRYPHAVGIATYRSTGAGEVREFHPIVPRHAPLPFRTPFEMAFPLFIRPNASNRLRIIIEEESASLGPSLAPGAASTNGDGHAQSRGDEFGKGHQVVNTLFIRDLPPPIPDQEDEAVISVDAHADAVLRFRVRCRGRELTYVYDRDRPQ
jgi:molecular chaperone DnaK (HSP70)